MPSSIVSIPKKEDFPQMAATGIAKGILERLKIIGEEQTKLAAETDMLWSRMYAFIDDVAGENQAYRYTHPTLKWTIGRVIAENSPRLDPEALKTSLPTDQWKLCTKQQRVFDLDRLTEAVAEGKISKDDVASATTTKPPTSRKHFKAASKDELKKLEEEKLS